MSDPALDADDPRPEPDPAEEPEPPGASALLLDAVEARVVGALIEKERATPQNYPLTLNALRTACNQTTGRDPITHLDDATIEQALRTLRERKLLRIVYSPSNRAPKYRHVLDEALQLDGPQLALLCVLLLRGPQTVGELNGRTERLADFADLASVERTLGDLAARPVPLVRRLERRPGQKDSRWAHLLLGAVDDPAGDLPAGAPRPGPLSRATPAAGEVDALRALLAETRDELARTRDDLAALRAEFEMFRAEFS